MKGIVVQTYSAFVISLGNCLCSGIVAWSSDALETLGSDNSPLGTKISKNDESLLGSLSMLGSFIATLYLSWLADNIGRKKTVILDALTFALSWAIIATASSIKQILIGRFFLGIAAGMHLISLAYIGEFSQTSIRGSLSSITSFSYTFGTLFAYLVGWFGSYDMTNYLPLCLSVIYAVLLCFLKESPAFLLAKGKNQQALKSLQFYRGLSGSDPKLSEELNILYKLRRPSFCLSDTKISGVISDHRSTTEEENEKLQIGDDDIMVNASNEITPWKLLMSSKANQRALVIAMIFIISMVFAGAIAVNAYAGKIFSLASPTLSPHLCSVFVALAFAVGGVLSVIVSDLLGRRTLFISSSVVSSVCLVALASLLRWNWLPEPWVPVFLLGYCCSYQAGMASVPVVQLVESFVPKLKSLTLMLAMINMWIGNFVILAAYPLLVDVIGLDGSFMVFSLLCAGSAVAAYFLMRETKAVPVEDIEKMFKHGFLYKSNK